MHKNEQELFPIWIDYYGKQFGYKNIRIFDNGSDDYMLAILKAAAKKGASVDFGFSTSEDFDKKGTIIANKIRKLDSKKVFDFYFPLDTDEFIGVKMEDGTISLEKEDIESELAQYVDSPDILMIHGGYDNHPSKKDTFVFKGGRKKCFFAQGACKDLTTGFHRAKANSSDKIIKTNIVHLHIHYKPFDILQSHAREKLKGRVADFEAETLIKFKEDKGKGQHLVDYLLYKDEDEYLSQFEQRFPVKKQYKIDAFSEKLNSLDIPTPYNL
ncbi:MAG: glycosyltransferase family 2 protein [Paraglaciecola sp.]